jgi:hypothetical protein
MYWVQVNENLSLVERERGNDYPNISITEDKGFVVLMGEESEVTGFVAKVGLTISDEGNI